MGGTQLLEVPLRVFSPRFGELLRDLSDSVGHHDSIKDWRKWQTRCATVVYWGATWRLNQRGDIPIHDRVGQLVMNFEHVSPVASGGGNSGLVFKPTPGRLLSSENRTIR
jgi:hypothetical protein